jgi:uncharacterized protein (DUF4415 family)
VIPHKARMPNKIVNYSIYSTKLAKLTVKQKAEIAALRKKRDADIDYSDIPPLTSEFLKSAVRNPFYKPVKASTTIRVDSDVLVWLKSDGKGYQTRLNAILREAMLKDLAN